MRHGFQTILRWVKWVLSPSYMIAHLAKNSMEKKYGRVGKFKAIFFLNRLWLSVSISIFIAVSVFPDFLDSSLSIYWQFILAYMLLFSRVNEIFFAFISDAFDKLSHKKQFGYFKMRLNLAFLSYLELIISFGMLYFLLSSNEIHPIAIKGVKSTIDALYFSGVTITTLGYGDFSPTQWYTKLLSVYQVFCGFSLLLVSFTIYTNRAMK